MKQYLPIIPLFFFSLIHFSANSQCQAPANLTAVYNNNVSTFSWDSVPGASGYMLEIKLQWDPWGTSGGIPVSGNTISLTGLFQTAPIDWRVSTDCGNGSFSTPTASSYSTPCPEASSPVASNITGTTATVNWTAPVGYNTTTTNFSVGYRLANTNNAWTSAGTTSATTKNLTGLLSNTAYEFCVTTSCMYANSVPVIGTFTTTYVACNIPTTISVTNATANQATVSWAAVSSVLNYTVEYKPVTSSSWSSVTSTPNSKILTGLMNATLYDVRVKANCSTASSNYINTQFTTYTSTCSAWGANGSEYIDLFQLGSISRTSGREVGGYINTNLITDIVKGSTTTGQFSVGYNPGIVFGENFAVYIDFNNNGRFNDAGERVVNPVYTASGATNNFTITIPNNVSTGTRKMRIVVCRSTSTINPCTTNFKGEAEDYRIKIVNSSNRMSLLSKKNEDKFNDEKELRNLSVYPNPSSGKFSIQLPGNFVTGSYEIINPVGSLIEKKNISSNNLLSIDLSAYSNGLYLVNINSANDNKKYSYKLNVVK